MEISRSSDVLLPHRGDFHCFTVNCVKFLILQAARPHFSFLSLSPFTFSPGKPHFLPGCCLSQPLSKPLVALAAVSEHRAPLGQDALGWWRGKCKPEAVLPGCGEKVWEQRQQPWEGGTLLWLWT